MAEHVNTRLALLQHDVTNEGFKVAISGFHVNKYDFVKDRTKAFNLYANRSADLSQHSFRVAVSNSISADEPSSPKQSFQALGKTINDAPVSTRASQRNALEASAAFSIVTDVTILPTFIGVDAV